MKFSSALIILFAALVSSIAEEPPAPWKHQDIGAAQVPGTAEHAAGVFPEQGTMDLWGPADGCQFLWQPLHGDGELVARVTSMDNPGGVAHAKASLCLRESLDPGARGVSLSVTAGDGTQFLYREEKDGKTARVPAEADAQKDAVPKAQFPCWLKLVRHGKEFTASESVDGQKWAPTGKITLPLSPDTVIGLAASSHKKDVLTKAVFDQVKLTH